MEIIRGFCNLSKHLNQCVVTLGNFDGIHLGHQSLISRLKQIGKEMNLPTVVILFEPQPLEFFNSERAPSRLTSFREKYLLIESLGIDYLAVISFNRCFASMSADQFIEQTLIKNLQAQYVIVGDDFCFGQNRQGNTTLLKHYADKSSFQLTCMPTYVINDQRVSSTAVRQALSNSDFNLAQLLLGRPYAIKGRVVHGNQLARQLGFPTANIHLNRKKPALHGVYLVKIKGNTLSHDYWGIANIGMRPAIAGNTAILEVNLFDFNQDIYGHCLEIVFVNKIRDEIKFDSLKALQAQTAQDVCIAKKIQAKFTQ